MSKESQRTHFLGGSDAAAVLGISPWKSPLDLYMQKTKPFEEPKDPNREKVLNRGKVLEPYVLDMLAREEKLTIKSRNVQHVDPEHSFLACEIDAEPDDTSTNIEIKTVSPFKAAEWGEEQTDAMPVHYAAQAMHGLMVTGRLRTVFGVLIGADDLRIYRIQRDDETIAAMRAREVAFWHNHVLARVPPEPSSGRDAERWFAPNDGLELFADNNVELLQAINRLRDVKATLRPLEAEQERLEGEIKLAMREATSITCEGRPLLTWKEQSRTGFDSGALKRAHPDLFTQFQKTTQFRVLRVK